MDTYQTLDDMADSFEVSLDGETKRMMANALNMIAKRRGDSVHMVRKRTKVNGNYQSYKVTAYPETYSDSFEQLCLLMNIWGE